MINKEEADCLHSFIHSFIHSTIHLFNIQNISLKSNRGTEEGFIKH